jgi:hypothetical protein
LFLDVNVDEHFAEVKFVSRIEEELSRIHEREVKHVR